MARLLIIGASQGIGLESVKAALKAGHTVRAFARSADKIALDDPYLEKLNGDALDATAMSHALNGQDVVIQCLGVAISPETILSGTRLFSQATRILVDATTAQAGTKRLIVVTGIGAGNSRDHIGPLYRAAFQLSLARIYEDKDTQEMIIQRSPLDWTIVRPGFLTNATASICRALLDPNDWRAGSVSRAAVAAFIIGHVNDDAYLRQTPLLIA
jgi:putative NADH-flavin reductase